MAKQWAIAIGINTYRSFQSLSYAQQDAEALCRFLIDEGLVAPENCLLLTPSSALHQGHSTFPLRETIAQWLKGLVTSAMGPEDSLWVYFSGYGVNFEGEDYLMPVDGDPARPRETGIAMKSVYGLLAQAPSREILLLLDMNRNAGSLGEPAGAHTASLARQTNLATVLSCDPLTQFSRESVGLRQGFFTAGLLEVLRGQLRQGGGAIALTALAPQLRQRVEELCEHYWRPVQTPLVLGQYNLRLSSSAAHLSAALGGAELPTEAYASSHASNNANSSASSHASSNGADSPPLSWDSPGQATGQGSTQAPKQPPGQMNGQANGSAKPIYETPLDIDHAPDENQGYGGDFADTWTSSWAWSLKGEDLAQTPGQTNETGTGESLEGSSGDAVSEEFSEAFSEDFSEDFGTDTPANDPLVDPYAAAWEEDFGDTVPLSSDSAAVQAAQAGDGGDRPKPEFWEAGQDNNLPSHSPQTQPHPLDSHPPENNGNGHGADGTNWHWADLTLATETATTSTAEDSTPLKPPLGPRPAEGNSPSGDDREEHNDADGLLSDPNWNWSGGAPEIEVEPDVAVGSPPGRPGGSVNYYPDDLFTDGDGGDSPGLPIIDLNDDELPFESDFQADGEGGLEGHLDGRIDGRIDGGIDGNGRRGDRPGWLSLRLLWALGLVGLVALALLGLFRGNSEDGASRSFGAWRSQSPEEADGNPANGEPTAPDRAPPSQGFAPAPVPPDPEFSDAVEAEEPSAPASSESVPTAPRPANGQAPGPGGPGPADGQAALANAQQGIQPGQASSLNRAIALARSIPPQDPAYAAAQQQMNRWSQETLALAETRARRGEYLEAIATARLVPNDLMGHSEAQQAINQWQLPAQLQHAQAVVRPGQASSYNRAIGIARNIPGGTPQHAEAQQLMQRWSNEIFDIAQQRANRGQWEQALAAAQLVPPDMPAFGAAQAAIADWQPQLNQPK